MNEVIQVTQLPVIKQNLLEAKETVLSRINAVKNMTITEDTRKEAKEVRAALNKEKAAFDEQLKAVKTAVMKPYEELLVTYKECITEPYTEADGIFKKKITEIEDGLKKSKKDEVESYFNEYAAVVNIDFVRFRDVPLNITLNSSIKSLKNVAKEFLDNIAEDIDSLLAMESKEELFAEYKSNGFKLAQAIATVDNRHKKIENEKEILASAMEQKKQQQEAVRKVVEAVTKLAKEEKKLYAMTFKVTATMEKLKELKEYLNKGGFKYE